MRQFSERKRQTDRAIWKIVIPAILESLLTYAVGLVTSALIGRLTENDISAQGIGLRVTMLVVALFRGIGVGATVVIGTAYGAGDTEKCRRLTDITMLVTAAGSVLLSLFVFLVPAPFLKLFTDDAALIADASRYLRVAVWMCPFASMGRVVTAAFNGYGNTRTPLVIAVITNVINAAAAWILIFGLGSIPALGLMGAAWSTVIANFCGIALGSVLLYRKNGLFSNTVCSIGGPAAALRDLKPIILTGLPASGENMLWTFAAMLMSRILLSYGTEVYAGYQLASQCEEVLAAPAFGFQIAASIIAAQSVGRQDREEFRFSYRRLRILSVLVSLPCMALMAGLPGLFMKILTDKVMLQQVGKTYLIIVAVAYLPQILNMEDFGVIRSLGHKLAPVLGSMLGMWCVRIPVAALAAYVWKADISIAFIGMAADQCFRYVFAQFFIRKEGLYDKRRTIHET